MLLKISFWLGISRTWIVIGRWSSKKQLFLLRNWTWQPCLRRQRRTETRLMMYSIEPSPIVLTTIKDKEKIKKSVEVVYIASNLHCTKATLSKFPSRILRKKLLCKKVHQFVFLTASSSRYQICTSHLTLVPDSSITCKHSNSCSKCRWVTSCTIQSDWIVKRERQIRRDR